MNLVKLLLMIAVYGLTMSSLEAQRFSFKEHIKNEKGAFKRLVISTDIPSWSNNIADAEIEFFPFKHLSINVGANYTGGITYHYDSDRFQWGIEDEEKIVKVGLRLYPFKHPRDLLKRKAHVNVEKFGCPRSLFAIKSILQGFYLGLEGVYNQTNLQIILPPDLELPERLELDLEDSLHKSGGIVSVGYAVRAKLLTVNLGIVSTLYIFDKEPNPLFITNLDSVETELVDLPLHNITFTPFLKVGLNF